MARLVGAARSWARSVRDLLYPPHCAACETPLADGLLCQPCRRALRPLDGPRCGRCGGPVSTARAVCPSCLRDVGALDGGTCFGVYLEERPLARLSQTLKYRGDRALVPVLGACLTRAARALERPEAVTFVPLDRRRRRARGFNQAELLAREVGAALDLPVVPTLRKVRPTRPQAALRRAARLTNLTGAFEAEARGYRHLWLVDDVRTTGATLSACAAALKESGARRVDALALAAAPPEVL